MCEPKDVTQFAKRLRRNLSPKSKKARGASLSRGGSNGKRPPRVRRPSLPQPGAAVLSARAGLTAEFGTGSGDPRLHGRTRGGRSPAGPLPAPRWRLHAPHRGPQASLRRARMKRRARAISAARLRRSHALHLRPIELVVYQCPYQRGISSRRRLPA